MAPCHTLLQGTAAEPMAVMLSGAKGHLSSAMRAAWPHAQVNQSSELGEEVVNRESDRLWILICILLQHVARVSLSQSLEHFYQLALLLFFCRPCWCHMMSFALFQCHIKVFKDLCVFNKYKSFLITIFSETYFCLMVHRKNTKKKYWLFLGIIVSQITGIRYSCGIQHIV